MFQDIISMALILALCCPLQIGGAIIRPDPIFVIYLMEWGLARAKKRLGYKLMHLPTALLYVYI